MEKYCKIICNKNRGAVEFIRAVDALDMYRLIGRPAWRYVGKTQYTHLVAYTPTTPMQFISAIQNTRLVNVKDWRYDFSISLVDGTKTSDYTFDQMLNFYCENCDDLSTSAAKDFKIVCKNIGDNLKLNEELKAEAYNEHGKLI